MTFKFEDPLEAIKVGLLYWLDTIVFDKDIPIMYSDQPAPRGPRPLVTWTYLTGLVKIGSFDEQVYDHTTETMSYRGFREFGATFRAIAETRDPHRKISPVGILTELQFAMGREKTTDYFRKLNISIRDEGSPTYVPEELDSEIEPRAVLDVVFGTALTDREIIKRIDSMKFSGTIKDIDGTTAVTIPETEVPKP